MLHCPRAMLYDHCVNGVLSRLQKENDLLRYFCDDSNVVCSLL
jgi:hypothetical protein